jgi:hypothetical protein
MRHVYLTTTNHNPNLAPGILEGCNQGMTIRKCVL